MGATGSIGKQTLDVLDLMPNLFEVNYITANKNTVFLEEICNKYKPNGVVITDETSYKDFVQTTNFTGRILFGDSGMEIAAGSDDNDLVLSALVGFSGVIPTLSAIESGIPVALANKESLVSAGNIIMSAAKINDIPILAVDSEHSAILQCLAGESVDSVEKIILTASGGPFRNTALEDFDKLTIQQALSHPNWTMGSKITIDSATMMNKGFEVIEAHWLFNLGPDKIDIVIHPQSIIHSFVQFTDGSVKAQLGMPDMRMPISYALTYPKRLKYDFPRIDLVELGHLDFQAPDYERYPCLRLALNSLSQGGNSPAALNAANEVCVNAFLNGEIQFSQIHRIIEKVLDKMKFYDNPDLDIIIQTDKSARELTLFLIQNQ